MSTTWVGERALPWCAVCAAHLVAAPGDYWCPLCAEPSPPPPERAPLSAAMRALIGQTR